METEVTKKKTMQKYYAMVRNLDDEGKIIRIETATLRELKAEVAKLQNREIITVYKGRPLVFREVRNLEVEL